MTVFQPIQDHLTRRNLLKGIVGTATGAALANWGCLFHSHTIAQEAQRQGKRCILLWMAGGPSHIDTWDPKPDRPLENRGPFGVINTKHDEKLVFETSEDVKGRAITAPIVMCIRSMPVWPLALSWLFDTDPYLCL